jgi:SagB-type dehydrogenase family enzyme
MKHIVQFLLIGLIAIIAGCTKLPIKGQAVEEDQLADIISLPQPSHDGPLSLEEALLQRRSTRQFTSAQLSMEQVSQLLWATQGITNELGFRTAPSAGALYPLEIYLVSQDGVFHYQPSTNVLVQHREGDLRRDVYEAALRQDAIIQAPITVVISAVYTRTSWKYGAARTPRYVHMEAGHAAQNLLLQAVSLGLGAVPIGAFEDKQVQAILGLPEDHEPLYLIPVGHPD